MGQMSSLDKQWEDKIEVICVDTLDEVMEHTGSKRREKESRTTLSA